MPRPRTGTVARVTLPDGRKAWQPICTLPDGTRRRLTPCEPGTSKAAARETAAYWSRRFAEEDTTRPEPTRTQARASTQAAEASAEEANAWIAAWLAERERRGIVDASAEQHWRLHIGPALRFKHPRDWTAADLRAFVGELDAVVQGKRLKWKSAANVWGTATIICADACQAKSDALRVRADNPALGVRGPDRGVKTAKQILYPSEAIALLRCGRVPLRYRRFVALSLYTGVRAGELRALRWSDADLEHGNVHVHRAWSNKRKRVESTKGMHNRRVPIEAPLAAPLEGMRGDAPRRSNRSGNRSARLKLAFPCVPSGI
jgi:integrase